MIFRRVACLLLAGIISCLPAARAQNSGSVDVAATKARAEQGDAEAANLLGNLYTNAQGVPRDHAEALKWYRLAAEKGFAPAQFNLGLAHELGRGIAQDEARALQYYQQAANQGFPAALFNVGNMYATGRGVKQDFFEANLWFKQAADKGVVEAQFNLGLAYEEGRGVKKDEVQAVRWYRQAADRGFPRAQYNLGLLLEDGRGAEKNTTLAATLYQQAALAGHAPAMNNLGLMYSQGRGGLAADPVLAYAWLTLAVENGVSPTARDFVGEDLTPEQRSAAGQLALDLKRRVARGSGPNPGPASTVARAAPGNAAGRELADALAEARSANARFAEANQRLEVEKAQLEQKIAQESSESRTLIENLRRQGERLQAQIQQAGSDKAAAEQTASALSAQLRDAQAELARARESAAAPPVNSTELAQAQENARRLAADRAAALREVEALRSQLQTTKDAAGQESAALNRQLAGLKDEVSRLRTAETKAPAGDLTRLQSRVSELQQANERLEQELQIARSQPPALSTGGRDNQTDTEKDNIIRNLQRDNQRLNDDVKRSTRELLSLNQQLRAATRGRSPTTDPASASSADTAKELADLQTEYSKLKDRADEGQAQLRRLEQELQAARTASSEQEQVQSQLAAVRRELADVRSEREQLAARLTTAEQRAQSLESDLATARKPAPPADVPALQGQLTEAGDRISSLRAELYKVQTENAGLAAQVESAKEDVTIIRSRLADAQAAAGAADSLRRQVAELTSTLEQRGRELAEARETAAAKPVVDAGEIERLRAQVDRLQREKSDLETAASDKVSARELREALAQVQDLKARLTEASAESERQGRAAAGLTVDNESLRRDLEEARKAAAAKPAVDTGEIDRLRSENQGLRVAADEAVALRNQVERLQREKSELEAAASDKVSAHELRAALAQVQDLKTRLTEAGAESERQGRAAAELTLDNERLRRELEEARAPRISASTSADRRELEAARAQIEDLQGQVARLQAAAATPAESPKLKAELAEATQAAERSAATIAELTAANESLQKDIANAQKSLAAALAAQSQAVDASKGEAYQLEIQTLTNRVKQLEGVLEEGQAGAAKEIASLAAQLVKTRETNRALVEANRALLQSKEAEKSFEADELTQAQQKLREATAATAAATEANQKLSAELAVAKQDLEQAQSLAAGSTALAEENRAIRARLAEFERATEATSSSVAELTGTNVKLEQELTELRQRVDRLQTENNRLTQDLRGATQTANAAGSQLAALRRDVDNARAANATLVESTAAQDRERTALIAQLREDNRALTVRLNQAQGVLDQIASAARLGTPASSIAGGNAAVRPAPVTTAPAAAPAARTHVIAEGDSLSKISLRYYGTAARWQEIYEANRDVLQGANALRVGQQLRIP